MTPWNHWFHICGSTYGSWLPGDPRGWRSFDHKQHVEGDYRRPPVVGTYDGLHDNAKQAMRRDAVVLSAAQQMVAARIMVEALTLRGTEVVDLCVARTHFHILCRFEKPASLGAESFRGTAVPRLWWSPFARLMEYNGWISRPWQRG
jgi:hypothetical protein